MEVNHERAGGKKRCQSEIARAWWDKKQAIITESVSLKEDFNRLSSKVQDLEKQ